MFVYPKVKLGKRIWLIWIAPFKPKYTRGRYAIGTRINGRNIRRFLLAGLGLTLYGKSRRFLRKYSR